MSRPTDGESSVPESPGRPGEDQPGDVPGERTRSPLAAADFVAGLRPIPSGPLRAGEQRASADIVGVTVDGAPVGVGATHGGGRLLVAFLHTRCDGCEEFWRGLGDPVEVGVPDSVEAVIVTKGPSDVAADEVGVLSTGITRVPVVMSNQAWSDYRVLGYPFFALVDRVGGVIVGETTAFGWSDVAAMIATVGD